MNQSLVWNYFDINSLKYDKRFTICLCKEANMKSQKTKCLFPMLQNLL